MNEEELAASPHLQEYSTFVEIYILLYYIYATTMCNMLNKRRKYNASLHNKPSTKKRRKVLRGEKKKTSDKHFLTEGKSYEAGGF